MKAPLDVAWNLHALNNTEVSGSGITLASLSGGWNVSIDNTGGSALDNYTVRIDITDSNIFVGGQEVIRFFDNDGTELGYYIVTWDSNNSHLVADVKVPSIGVEVHTITFNVDASRTVDNSSKENAYLLYDDFTGTQIDTTKWKVGAVGGLSVSQNNGLIVGGTSGGTESAGIMSVNTLGDNFEIEASVRGTTLTSSFYGGLVQGVRNTIAGAYTPNYAVADYKTGTSLAFETYYEKLVNGTTVNYNNHPNLNTDYTLKLKTVGTSDTGVFDTESHSVANYAESQKYGGFVASTGYSGKTASYTVHWIKITRVAPIPPTITVTSASGYASSGTVTSPILALNGKVTWTGEELNGTRIDTDLSDPKMIEYRSSSTSPGTPDGTINGVDYWLPNRWGDTPTWQEVTQGTTLQGDYIQLRITLKGAD